MERLFDHVLHSVGGKFGDATDSKATDVDRILTLASAADAPNGLLLHFHGGLVNKASGLQIAARLTPLYEDAGTYPIFFVWESGLVESLLNNKDDILRDPAFRELVKKVSEWVLKRATGSVVLKGGPGYMVDVDGLRKEYDKWFDRLRDNPPLPDHQVTTAGVASKGADNESEEDLALDIEDGLDNDPEFRKAIEDAYNAQLPPDVVPTKGIGTREKAEVSLLSDGARREMFGEISPETTKGGFLTRLNVARFVAKIVIAVLKRYAKHRDHGAYCTVVEEVLRSAYGDLIGSTVWNQMKKDTGDSFDIGAGFCGTDVIAALRSLEQSKSGLSRITLVGHSTGAIYICNFLDAAKAAGIEASIKVVFLAPALTHRVFAKAIKSHAGTARLQAFRLFGMTDQAETEDRLLGVLYTRSLLYFVSGLLEGDAVDGLWKDEIDMPIGGMQRFLEEAIFKGEDFGDIKTVSDFLLADYTRTVWSPANKGPGLNSLSARHGDFDDDVPTLESVKTFIAG